MMLVEQGSLALQFVQQGGPGIHAFCITACCLRMVLLSPDSTLYVAAVL
jgi:hypothetical protein